LPALLSVLDLPPPSRQLIITMVPRSGVKFHLALLKTILR
jgi:hypothetical protein